MKEQIQAKFDEDGVSPVIGVILMVAVTVALVALVTVIVFDIGGDVSESPDATVDLSQDGSNVTATVLRNENVDTFRLTTSSYASLSSGTYEYTNSGTADWGTYPTVLEMSSVGDTANIPDSVYPDSSSSGTATTSAQLSAGDQVQVIAVMSDGSEQVLTTTTYDG